jgi:2-C-methyl-D-erythritol 2,4-cyclodiphosphate synthase
MRQRIVRCCSSAASTLNFAMLGIQLALFFTSVTVDAFATNHPVRPASGPFLRTCASVSLLATSSSSVESETAVSTMLPSTIAKVQSDVPYPIEDLSMRIGHGFDIHKMVPIEEAKQPVVISGVTIPHDPLPWLDVEGKYTSAPGSIYQTTLGLLAHSDGDVVYHSIVDAILGALTLPDIGQVFSDTDPYWRGCDSSQFMNFVYTQVLQHYGYRINNLDVTLILERPKVGKFVPQMKQNICDLLHTTPSRVNVKARTHERVDAVGQLRAVSCHVVAILEKIV